MLRVWIPVISICVFIFFFKKAPKKTQQTQNSFIVLEISSPLWIAGSCADSVQQSLRKSIQDCRLTPFHASFLTLDWDYSIHPASFNFCLMSQGMWVSDGLLILFFQGVCPPSLLRVAWCSSASLLTGRAELCCAFPSQVPWCMSLRAASYWVRTCARAQQGKGSFASWHQKPLD